MNIFIVIDGHSQVSPKRVREALKTHCEREEYEVLPLAAEVFEPFRGDYAILRARATLEATRALEHYERMDCCLVVYAEPTNPKQSGTKTLFCDRTIAKFRGEAVREVILNTLVGVSKANKYMASSPTLQPQLTDAFLEYALIDVAKKY